MKGNKSYYEVWVKYLNSGSGAKQRCHELCRWWWCRAARKYWKPEEENEEIFNSYRGKVKRWRQIQRGPFQPSSSWRKTIEMCKKRWRKTLRQDCRGQLRRIKTVELSWNTWRTAMTSYHFSVTRVKQLEHHSQKLAEKHETSLTKVTQPDGNNQDPLKYSQRTSLKI